MKQKEYELKILDEAVEKLESGKAVFYSIMQLEMMH